MTETKLEQEKKIVGDIVQRVQSSDEFLKPYIENWTRYYKLYRSYIDDNKWPTKSKIFNPYIWSAIETQTSKAVATKPNGEFVPSDENSNADNTEDIGYAFDSWWRKERMNFTAQSGFKKGMIYGTFIARIFWNWSTGFRGGKKVVVKDRPKVKITRLEDGLVGFDPEPDEESGIRWMFYKDYVSKQDIENWKEGPSKDLYQNLDKAIESFEKDEYEKNAYRDEKLSAVKAKGVQDTTIKKVELIYMEVFETGDCYMLVGRKHLVKKEKNPYLFDSSFIIVNNSIVPNEILGMSDVEPTERLQHGLNLIQNQRRDNVEAVLKHQWIVGDDAGIEDDELVDELNGIIHAKDINKIKPNVKPNVTQSAYQEEQALKNDIQQALSVSNFSKGTDEVDTSRSGVAIEKLQNAADARVRTKLDLFEIQFVKAVAEKWQRLMAQYQKDPVTVVVGGEVRSISPEVFKGEFDYFVEAGSTKHTDPYQGRQTFAEYKQQLLELADRKMAQMKEEQLAKSQLNAPPQVDPKTGQPLQQLPVVAPPKPVVDFDKLAEELSEVYGQKNWRELWLIEEKKDQSEMQQLPSTEPEEYLPSVDLEERQKGLPEGENLPGIDDLPEAQGTANNQGEMLPSL